eukprot:1853603-Pyramimonas_sp.AAC.1
MPQPAAFSSLAWDFLDWLGADPDCVAEVGVAYAAWGWDFHDGNSGVFLCSHVAACAISRIKRPIVLSFSGVRACGCNIFVVTINEELSVFRVYNYCCVCVVIVIALSTKRTSTKCPAPLLVRDMCSAASIPIGSLPSILPWLPSFWCSSSDNRA